MCENFLHEFNFRHLATWQKLNVQTFLTRKKKSYTKISQSTVYHNIPTSAGDKY